MIPLPERCYPTVAELVSSARALAAQRPDLCVLRQVGASRAGRPLHLLSVGRARRAVLVVAGAHANEPAGGSTLLALARRVLQERELRNGTSWHFLLCADPDGASLHVMAAPRSLYDYHLGFFRPAGPEQPEWAPSVLPPDRLPPETRALLGVIDELRPYLQVSLHGTDLGGSWVQLTRDVPGLAEPFAKSAAELHIPVETGASDAAGWPASGPGVRVMPAPEAGPAYPSLPDDARHSTWYHAHRYGGLTAVVEVPMWAGAVVDDPAPHPAPAAALQVLADRLLRDAGEVRRVLRDARPRPGDTDDPLLRAAVWGLDLVPGLASDLVRTPPADGTRAYVGSVDAFARRVPLRAAAMLRRALSGTDAHAAARLEHLVALWSDAFAVHFRARWVPVEHQVEHQSRTVVAAALHARERAV
ncbi:M14 family zinc carboxypeptidase [Streptomyces viridosporus]|uniref:3-hydroxyacyl-CoA dehydrogenase n=1 Tax=Streptomyces viridosporus T7A TaxID=665577 RepID=A0ABX6AM75_STRVD|nr:M14 family zinc carboxypeptidase [Streptomyces viridosporus]QEU88357.1 3-hydroxyacyl-CoA dehydrogenase [Streptomyces viridosporus T7A]